LETRSSSDLLAQPGVVELTLPDADGLRLWSDLEPLEVGADAYPPSLEDDVMASRVVTWVRIRLPGEEERGGGSKQIEARLSWIGINCARVQQRWRIRGERLGLGSGEPDQRFTLANTPVIKDSVELTVNGEAWEHIDALHAAAPEVPGLLGDDGETTAATGVTRSPKVFTVDRESGDIAFGDGYRGMRPPRGAVIIADYDTGGGPRGNVPIGAINSSTDLPQGMQVHNAVPTWGGTESESVDSAQRRIPGWLRHRDRLVSEEDYRQIVEDTPGVALGRSEILPLMHPELPDVTSEGVVTVMVVPRHDPIQPDAPRADRLFLQAVCAHLEPRRILTTELHVRGPEYVPIYVSVGITLVPHADTTAAIHEVQKRLRTFLSPLTGGFEESGWTLHRPVVPAELLAVAARVTTVSQVNDVLLGDAQGVERLSLPMEGLQLPRLMALSVTEGDAVPVQNLLPDTLADPATLDERLVPVPVIPEVC
jgi:predicted phage baseplate assembly protein